MCKRVFESLSTGLENLLAFHPYRARDLVSDCNSSDGLEFRVQKDILSRFSDDAADVDRDASNSNIDGDDFGVLNVAAEAMQDAGMWPFMSCVIALLTFFPPFYPATNNAGFTRDEANVSREDNPMEFQSKKVHLDTSAIALDAVISGMPGLHHHLHDRVLHAPLAPLRPC